MTDARARYRVREEVGHDGAIMVMLLAMVLMGALAVGHLPARVPTHFGLDGQANGWSSPIQAAFLPVAMAAALWLLLLVLPRIDPRRRSYPQFAASYRLVRAVPVALLLVMDGATLLGGVGVRVDMRLVAALALTAVLFVLGNLLPRVRPTWFVGIRTPWTLSSDEVWRQTHRLGGRLFVAAAFLPLLAALFAPSALMPAVLVAALLPLLGSAAYSWLLFERIGRQSADS